jgi:heat shock protein HtpX
MNNNLYQNQKTNIFKTWFYLLSFALLLVAVGFIASAIFGSPTFMYIGLIMAIGTNFFSYFFSDSIVLKMSQASPLGNGERDDLVHMVEKLAMEKGIPAPKVYMVNDAAPNAFATGRNPKKGVIAFTTGILALLSKEELEGVTAHELSHIANRDTLVSTVVAVMASIISFFGNMFYYGSFMGGNNNDNENSSSPIFGIIGFVVIVFLAPLAATIVQMAISRKRELLADATGARMTGKPLQLANALKKISGFPVPMQTATPSIAHLYISDPFKNENRRTPWYVSMFMTHPPVEERVKALLGE